MTRSYDDGDQSGSHAGYRHRDNPFTRAVPYPHQEFGPGRQKKVPPIERRPVPQPAEGYSLTLMSYSDGDGNVTRRVPTPTDIERELGIRYEWHGGGPPSPEPYVAPSGAVGVLLVGMFLGGAVTFWCFIAAIKLGWL